MLVQEECVEVHALKQRGWLISAIARHFGKRPKDRASVSVGRADPGRTSPW